MLKIVAERLSLLEELFVKIQQLDEDMNVYFVYFSHILVVPLSFKFQCYLKGAVIEFQ